MAADDKFDGLFMTAVQQSQGIDNLFQNLFSFMRRRTDFFSDPAKSQKIVEEAFQRNLNEWQMAKAKESALKRRKEEEERKRKAREAEEKEKAGESFAQEVTEEEAARIEAEEKAKKEGKKVPEPSKKSEGDEEDKEEKDEDGKSKGVKPNSGNGGDTDKYSWTQTLAELTMNIFLPKEIKTKDLTV